MFLTPEVCKLPFASQFWLWLPTAVCDKFQYLHFSVALKCSRLNRGSLNMEQCSCLVLQKGSVPHPETCLKRRHLEPLCGIRTIYKLHLVIVKIKKKPRVSGVLQIRKGITCYNLCWVLPLFLIKPTEKPTREQKKNALHPAVGVGTSKVGQQPCVQRPVHHLYYVALFLQHYECIPSPCKAWFILS